jgi:hypothetical protein
MWEQELMPRITRSATERRNVLAGAGAALLAGTFASGHASADTTTSHARQGQETSGMPAPEYAIFTELSPDSKPLKDGWNTRVFTNTDAQTGSGITCRRQADAARSAGDQRRLVYQPWHRVFLIGDDRHRKN